MDWLLLGHLLAPSHPQATAGAPTTFSWGQPVRIVEPSKFSCQLQAVHRAFHPQMSETICLELKAWQGNFPWCTSSTLSRVSVPPLDVQFTQSHETRVPHNVHCPTGLNTARYTVAVLFTTHPVVNP